MDSTNEEEANTKVAKLEDLMIEILSRLPAKTLLSFRCICKPWFRLMSDKYFANLHLSRSPPGILIKVSTDRGMSSALHLIQIVETGETFKVERMKFVPETNLPATSDFELMNSCNGLLCLSEGESHNVIHVCNPVLGQYITIPVDDDNDKAFAHGNFFALGFSQATDQYKVIRTFYSKIKSDHQKSNCKAEIYTIGSTREWRSLRNAFSMGRLDFNTCVDGRIHWVLHDKRPWRRICSFDFESEEFSKFTLPFKFDGKTCQLKLGVSKGCLCVTVERLGLGVRFDVWVMKEYGVKKSWIKEYVIENLYPDDNHLDYYEPLIILSNGNILTSFNEKLIVCYNTKTRRLDEEIAQVYQAEGFIDAIAYTPSFVSLSDVAKGEQMKALRTNMGLTEIAKYLKRGSDDGTEEGD